MPRVNSTAIARVRAGLGDKLPNGATFVAEAGDVVLAKFRDPQPWVTWRFHPSVGYSTTGAGHYFDDLRDAVEDFYVRAGIN